MLARSEYRVTMKKILRIQLSRFSFGQKNNEEKKNKEYLNKNVNKFMEILHDFPKKQ
jgi:hypothetical protein